MSDEEYVKYRVQQGRNLYFIKFIIAADTNYGIQMSNQFQLRFEDGNRNCGGRLPE